MAEDNSIEVMVILEDAEDGEWVCSVCPNLVGCMVNVFKEFNEWAWSKFQLYSEVTLLDNGRWQLSVYKSWIEDDAKYDGYKVLATYDSPAEFIEAVVSEFGRERPFDLDYYDAGIANRSVKLSRRPDVLLH